MLPKRRRRTGNAFPTFIAQNYGTKKEEQIRSGLKGAVLATADAVGVLYYIIRRKSC